ncbi:uncharacterized protein V6R79_008714 [Siganus canaliculatus]
MHERKLRKELKKLSVQSWPSRDRLVVFSDVFDDVCEDSPVFGRILREIKVFPFPLVESVHYAKHFFSFAVVIFYCYLVHWTNTVVEELASGKMRETRVRGCLKKRFCRLQQEARRALQENEQVRNELQNVPDFLDPEDIDVKKLCCKGAAISCSDGPVQSKRLQVLNTRREIRQLEKEIKEKLVPLATTTTTEKRIKDVKTDNEADSLK